MKIALINENSQASKNHIIYDSLKEATDKKTTNYLTMVCVEKKEKVN
ncbi:ribose 5-phosphate isomerase RpiB domain protein [Streptococcus pneumoniae 2070335]|nr:ribose 5-phosphate isomerase RpiB domain protein [Streptococcus pneumoniae 2070335]